MATTFAALSLAVAGYKTYKAVQARREAEARARAFNYSTVRYDYNRCTAVKSGASY